MGELGRANVNLVLGSGSCVALILRRVLLLLLDNLTLLLLGLSSLRLLSCIDLRAILCLGSSGLLSVGLRQFEFHEWVRIVNLNVLETNLGAHGFQTGDMGEHLHANGPVDTWLKVNFDGTGADRHATAWFQDTEDFAEGLLFVWGETEGPIRNDNVNHVIWQWNVFHISCQELHV